MSATGLFRFERPALAKAVTDMILGRTLGNYLSGVFLSAPRRTGKTTLLRDEVMPLLESEGIKVVYVDLWSKREDNPADLIVSALREALAETRVGLIESARRDGGLRKVLGVELGDIGMPDVMGIVQMIEALIRRTGKPVVLIVDEAQHAPSTPEGGNALFSLKAARDRLNIGPGFLGPDWKGRNLMLAFTGSDRHRLHALVADSRAAFFGASITPLPLLGDDYAAAYAGWLAQRFGGNAATEDEVVRAFSLLWNRPEALTEATGRAYAAGTSLLEEAGNLRAEVWIENRRIFDALLPEHAAVLSVVGKSGPDDTAFSKRTLEMCGKALGCPMTASEVQAALDGLTSAGHMRRERTGRYVAEQRDMAEWLVDVNPTLPQLIEAPRDVSTMISELRVHGIPMTALADLAGVSFRTMKRWSEGRVVKSAVDARRLTTTYQILTHPHGPPWESIDREALRVALATSYPDVADIVTRMSATRR